MISRRIEIIVGNGRDRNQRLVDVGSVSAPQNAAGARPVSILNHNQENNLIARLAIATRERNSHQQAGHEDSHDTEREVKRIHGVSFRSCSGTFLHCLARQQQWDEE
jgi:hypothetical protein